jgi:hypothetical protein
MGLSLALAVYFQACVITGSRRLFMPSHPPAFMIERIARGENPATISRNWRTSLYIALVRPPRKVYTRTITADASTETSKFHPSTRCSSCPRANIEMPEEKMVMMAKEKALNARVFSS